MSNPLREIGPFWFAVIFVLGPLCGIAMSFEVRSTNWAMVLAAIAVAAPFVLAALRTWF